MVQAHNHGGVTGKSVPRIVDGKGAHFSGCPTVDVDRVGGSGDKGRKGSHGLMNVETHTHTVPWDGGEETRPANMSMVYLMRFK